MAETTLLGTALSAFALDQATKALVLGATGTTPFWGFVRLVKNARMGGGFSPGLLVLIVVWIAEVTLLVWLVDSGVISSALAQAALGLALGGATGNLLDRLNRGAVIDFIDLRVWPVFNVADAAIVSGAVIAALTLF